MQERNPGRISGRPPLVGMHRVVGPRGSTCEARAPAGARRGSVGNSGVTTDVGLPVMAGARPLALASSSSKAADACPTGCVGPGSATPTAHCSRGPVGRSRADCHEHARGLRRQPRAAEPGGDRAPGRGRWAAACAGRWVLWWRGTDHRTRRREAPATTDRHVPLRPSGTSRFLHLPFERRRASSLELGQRQGRRVRRTRVWRSSALGATMAP